jgi:deoxyribodipyrimidine photo-lyase
MAEIHFRNPASRRHDAHIEPFFNGIPWASGAEAHALWTMLDSCKTGFLLIDAAMTQMKSVGHCPNYARMLLSFFWTKLLRIDPNDAKYGSQAVFSRYLVDAIGPSQNKLNHEWLLSMDFAGRRFAPKGSPLAGRPFDIVKAVGKLDREGFYIRRWLPHLRDVPAKVLKRWDIEASATWGHVPPMFDPSSRWAQWVAICRR